MWREAVLAALVLQGSQIPIGVKSHMFGLGGGGYSLCQGIDYRHKTFIWPLKDTAFTKDEYIHTHDTLK